MNNQFGGFDVDPFGTQFPGNGAPASMVQNSQQRAYSASNGPCREDYDPTRVLGGGSPAAPYNSTGFSTNTGTNTVSASIHASNNNNHLTGTHQTLLPPPMAQVGTSLNGGAALGNLIMGSTGQHSSNGGANTNIYNDLNFDPLTSMRALHPPAQTAAQQQAVVNQHLHQHQHVHHHHHHHLTQPSHRQYRKQHPQQLKQQSSHRPSSSSSGGTAMPSSSASYANNIFAQPQSVSSLDQQQHQITRHLEEQAKKKEPPKPEPWMEELKITVSGVALEPMSGYEVIKKLQKRATEVLTRYLPCVHFLVQCQQDLRKGLATAQQKRLIHHMLRDAMTPRQFYTTFIANLPKRFYQENRRIMSTENLNSAFKELQKLCANAKEAEPQGCEIVKNTFLGGMKDGESWGLRKWLSKQGGALYICNDTECLLNSCQKLDRSKSTTAKLASKLRPLAKNALTRLKNEVPSSYQERSSAHPYLPFFHRLESALRGMSEFDPEDDDVICIDDDEVEELKAKAPAPAPKPKKQNTSTSSSSKASSTKTTKRKASEISKTPKKESDGGASDKIAGDFALDLDSDIEIVDGKPPAKRAKALSPVGGAAALLESVTADDSDYMKTLLSTFEDDNIAAIADFDVFDEKHSLDNDFTGEKDAYDLATGIDQLARLFESSQEDVVRPDFVVPDEFWDQGKIYAKCLRMFSDMLRDPNTSTHFLEPISEDRLLQEGKPSYSDKIKHPICFRDIVNALLEDFSPADNTLTGNTGTLPDQSLVNWNMFNGKELVQAIDIVFLNCLAYEKVVGGSKSPVRSLTNQLRKKLWAFITELVEEGQFDDDQRKKHTPTRRSESSGFVLLEKSKKKK